MCIGFVRISVRLRRSYQVVFFTNCNSLFFGTKWHDLHLTTIFSCFTAVLETFSSFENRWFMYGWLPRSLLSPRYSIFSEYFHKIQCKFFDIIKCLIKSPFLLLRLSRPESIFIEFKIFGVLASGRLLVSDVIFILYTRLFGHPS